jgi:hypothetical protein
MPLLITDAGLIIGITIIKIAILCMIIASVYYICVNILEYEYKNDRIIIGIYIIFSIGIFVSGYIIGLLK